MPDSEVQLLAKNLIQRQFKKGETLIEVGQIQRELYLVKSGVQMSFFESGSKIHVIAFTYPPNFCAIPGSLTVRQPSNCTITCLSDSEMDAISFNKLEQLFASNRSLERFFFTLTEMVLVGLINRHIDLHCKTMTERYREFCQRSPQLLQIVPHKYIASYLGIDPTNFSKLFNSVRI